jgi:hypothetical protein
MDDAPPFGDSIDPGETGLMALDVTAMTAKPHSGETVSDFAEAGG